MKEKQVTIFKKNMKLYNIQTDDVIIPTVVITLEDFLKMAETLYSGSPSDAQRVISQIQALTDDLETQDNTNV